jgi:hypothetical protein
MTAKVKERLTQDFDMERFNLQDDDDDVICSLINNFFFSDSDYIVLHEGVIGDELERMWKEVVMAYF